MNAKVIKMLINQFYIFISNTFLGLLMVHYVFPMRKILLYYCRI